MPSIDVAMARSVQKGLFESLRDSFANTVVSEMQKRDIIQDAEGKVSDVKTAFSSWDNCMHAAYCKWPVIAIIVIGSLILISIITCIVRCACCGMSCCCSCFRCLKCGNCCGCCDPPNDRKHKYLDAPYVPPHHGYQQQAPMQAPIQAQRPMASGPPQYAEFEMARKGGEDSLPQMPGWDNAGSKKVMLEEEVEMADLKKQNTDQLGPSGRGTPMSNDPRFRNQGSLAGSSTYGNGNPNNGPYQRRAVSPVSPAQTPFDGRTNPYGPPGAQQMGAIPNQGYQQQGADYGRSMGNWPASNQAPQQPEGLSDGYGLDQPYDSNHGVSIGAMGAAGAVGAAGAAALAAGAMARHQSPSPGAHGHGQPPSATAGYAEMPNEPSRYSNSPPRGYAEMSSDVNAVGGNQHSPPGQFAEMSASPTRSVQTRTTPKPQEPQQAIFEMPTDQIAPVELDGGFGQVAPSPSQNSFHSAVGELPTPDHNRPGPDTSFGNGPGEYGIRQVAPSPAPGAIINPAAYATDPRARNSPGPRSPDGPMTPGGPMGPGPRGPGGPGSYPDPRNSPGPGVRSSPGPRNSPGFRPSPGSRQTSGSRQPQGPQGNRPEYRYTPSPMNTPGPYGDSAYSRPPPHRDGSGRSYSPGPQRTPLAHPTPIAPPAPMMPQSPLESPPHSPITNNSGFDFTSGYARPRTGHSERRPSESADGGNGYPGGYQPFQPSQGGYRG